MPAPALKLLAACAAMVALVALALLWHRPTGYELRVYGFASDAPVRELLADLDAAGVGEKVVFADLAQRANGERFSRLMVVINTEADIPFLPSSVERRDFPPTSTSTTATSTTSTTWRRSRACSTAGGWWPSSSVARGRARSSGRSCWRRRTRRTGTRVIVPSGDYVVTDKRIVDEMSRLLLGQGGIER